MIVRYPFLVTAGCSHLRAGVEISAVPKENNGQGCPDFVLECTPAYMQTHLRSCVVDMEFVVLAYRDITRCDFLF